MSTGSLHVSTLKFCSTFTFGEVRGTAGVDRRIGKISSYKYTFVKNGNVARLFSLFNRSDERCGLFVCGV
jgi:hypothetical protein